MQLEAGGTRRAIAFPRASAGPRRPRGQKRSFPASVMRVSATRGMRSCHGSAPDESFRSGTSRFRSCAPATLRALADGGQGDLDADAPLASAVGCPPPPRSLTPPRRPLSNNRGRAPRGWPRWRDCPTAALSQLQSERRLVAACSRGSCTNERHCGQHTVTRTVEAELWRFN
jgi:hypothetical protein